jgi:methionine sulfoxide reductase heme-binding subunit
VNKFLTSKWTKLVVFLICLIPAADLTARALAAVFAGLPLETYLTPDPIKFITHRTGDWTIRFIIFTLAITPLRKLLRLPQLIRFRRMLGLFAFFYASLHFLTWMVLDKFFDWRDMWADVYKRPFITLGFLAFVLMIPLALTSTAGMIRRLGGKRWQQLHRLIYVTACLGAIHYYWSVKSDVRKPLFFAALIAVLLAWRLGAWVIGRRNNPTTAAIPESRPTASA